MRITLAFVVLLAACGNGNQPTDAGVDLTGGPDLTAPPICTDAEIGDAGVPPTFANVQRVFNNACIGCHCCGDAVDLTATKSYASIVNRTVTSENGTNETCGGPIVTPGDPTRSYLYQKISQTSSCAGNPMPLNEFQFFPLPMCQQDLIHRWILAGAQNN
jgi:hypothetical protein